MTILRVQLLDVLGGEDESLPEDLHFACTKDDGMVYIIAFRFHVFVYNP